MLILSVVLLSAQATTPAQRTEYARREQVMQWGLKADAVSCQCLEGALTDPSADIRIRAVTAPYGKCNKRGDGIAGGHAAMPPVDLGNASAATFLLLGYAPKVEAEPCLRKVRPA